MSWYSKDSKDVDIMGGFRIKKRVRDLVRSNALQKLTKVAQVKIQNFQIRASYRALKLQNPTLWDTRGGARVVWEARFPQSPTSHTTRTPPLVSQSVGFWNFNAL